MKISLLGIASGERAGRGGTDFFAAKRPTGKSFPVVMGMER